MRIPFTFNLSPFTLYVLSLFTFHFAKSILPHFKIDCKGTTKIAYMQVFAHFFLCISFFFCTFAPAKVFDKHKTNLNNIKNKQFLCG